MCLHAGHGACGKPVHTTLFIHEGIAGFLSPSRSMLKGHKNAYLEPVICAIK
jgi:hypothetical protein